MTRQRSPIQRISLHLLCVAAIAALSGCATSTQDTGARTSDAPSVQRNEMASRIEHLQVTQRNVAFGGTRFGEAVSYTHLTLPTICSV